MRETTVNDNEDEKPNALGDLLGKLAASPTPDVKLTFEDVREALAAQVQADVAGLIGHEYPLETVLVAIDGASQMAAHAEKLIKEGLEVAVRVHGPKGQLVIPVGLNCAPGSKPVAPNVILDALLSRLILSPSTVLVLGAHGYGMTLVSKKPKSRLVIEQH